MSQKSTSENLAEAMVQARRQWQLQRKTDAAPGIPLAPSYPAFTIALSREAGANGSLIGRAIAERLGWLVYDRELVQHIAEDMGVRTSLIESVDEKHQSWLLECLESFAAASKASESGYVRHLLQTLVSLGIHGECVVVGRGAAQVLPSATTLRVRLFAPFEERVTVISQRLGISRKEAAQWVEKTDGERVRFVKEHFHIDSTDPQHYDLMVNSSRFTVPDCADLVVDAVRRLPVAASERKSVLQAPAESIANRKWESAGKPGGDGVQF